MNTPRSLLLLLAASACAPSIADLPLDDTDEDTQVSGGDTDDTSADDGPISDADSDGVRTAHVDATSDSAWVYVDVDANTLVGASEAWSLGFQRSNIMLNGGVSGDAGVEVAWSASAFADATDAPTTGWTTDAADANDDGVPEYALAWYDYDEATHVLTPKAGTWFVRTAGGHTIAVEILDYYDDAGTSAMPSFRYKPVDDAGVSMPEEHTLGVDASSATDFVYVSLATAGTISPPVDPANSLAWDLAFRRTTIQLNGGVNGSGAGEAVTLPDETVWEDVTEAPADGWTQDVAPPSPYQDGTALESWYDYNPSTHAVSAPGRIHVVRDAAGDAWKFSVTSWTDGAFTVRFAALEAQ